MYFPMSQNAMSWVNGVAGANAFYTPPGCTSWLMDRTGNMNQNRDWYGRHSRDDGRRMMTSEVENLMGRLSGHDREILERLMEQLQNA